MTIISKQLLQQEIDRLDSQYLELIYKILQQFPHEQTVERISLNGSVLHYITPTEPVAVDDWGALR